MSESTETTFLQEDFVKVTDQKVIIGTTAYPLIEIKAVRLTTQPKSYRSLWLVAAGLPLIIWSLLDETRQFAPFLNIGAALILVGLVLVVLSKPTYGIQIAGAAGEKSILKSTKLAFVQKAVDAIKNAITYREELDRGIK